MPILSEFCFSYNLKTRKYIELEAIITMGVNAIVEYLFVNFERNLCWSIFMGGGGRERLNYHTLRLIRVFFKPLNTFNLDFMREKIE